MEQTNYIYCILAVLWLIKDQQTSLNKRVREFLNIQRKRQFRAECYGFRDSSFRRALKFQVDQWLNYSFQSNVQCLSSFPDSDSDSYSGTESRFPYRYREQIQSAEIITSRFSLWEWIYILDQSCMPLLFPNGALARCSVIWCIWLLKEMTIFSGDFKKLLEFKNCIIIDMDQTCMPYSFLTTLWRIVVAIRDRLLLLNTDICHLPDDDDNNEKYHFIFRPSQSDELSEWD